VYLFRVLLRITLAFIFCFCAEMGLDGKAVNAFLGYYNPNEGSGCVSDNNMTAIRSSANVIVIDVMTKLRTLCGGFQDSMAKIKTRADGTMTTTMTTWVVVVV
jgi:hypothetical protein